MMVLIRVEGEPIAFLVDSIGAVVTVNSSQFEPPPDTLSGHTRELIRGAYSWRTGCCCLLTWTGPSRLSLLPGAGLTGRSAGLTGPCPGDA